MAIIYVMTSVLVYLCHGALVTLVGAARVLLDAVHQQGILPASRRGEIFIFRDEAF